MILLSKMSRIFLALTPDSELTNLISNLKKRQKHFSLKNSTISWAEENDYHITVNFVGSMEPEQKEEMFIALENKSKLKKLPIEISHLSYFPNENSQVFVANINLSPRLQQLYDEVEKIVIRIGFGMTLKLYKPHISLARFKEKTRPFSEIIELEKPISSTMNSLDVYESDFSSGKNRHSLIKSYDFE